MQTRLYYHYKIIIAFIFLDHLGVKILICGVMGLTKGSDGGNQSWLVLVPVCSAMGIQAVRLIGKCCYRLWSKPTAANNGVCPSLNETSNTVAYKIWSGVGSLVSSAAIDGHSHTGLWSSAVFVSFSIWTKLFWLTYDKWSRNDYSTIVSLTTATLILSMFSYCLNLCLVLRTGQHRLTCVVVSVLGAIVPVYLHIIAATHNSHMWRAVFWRITGYTDSHIDRVLSDAWFTATVTAILPTLITITTLSALLILLTIISLLLSIISAVRTLGNLTHSLTHMETDFTQQTENCNGYNDHTRISQII